MSLPTKEHDGKKEKTSHVLETPPKRLRVFQSTQEKQINSKHGVRLTFGGKKTKR